MGPILVMSSAIGPFPEVACSTFGSTVRDYSTATRSAAGPPSTTTPDGEGSPTVSRSRSKRVGRERAIEEWAFDRVAQDLTAHPKGRLAGTQGSVSCGRRDRCVLLGRRSIQSLEHDPRPTRVCEEGPGPGEEYRQLSAETDQEQNVYEKP